MTHTLPPLPYSRDALAPHISAETIDYHYGKHHQAYVDNLNKLVPGTEYEQLSLEDIIRRAQGAVFNNAAQVWNHTFYWRCLKPAGGGEPKGDLAQALTRAFGGFPEFRQQFTQAAVSLFGSGWAWLVKQRDGSCSVVQTSNAGTPVQTGVTPLLVCDVWEHAYYIDHRNARAKYVEGFWNLVSWDAVAQNLSR